MGYQKIFRILNIDSALLFSLVRKRLEMLLLYIFGNLTRYKTEAFVVC